MMPTAVIFDLDGTLLDSMLVWDTLGENYLRSKGVTPLAHVRDDLKTMTLFQAAVYFKREYHLTGTAEEITDEINAMIDHAYRFDVQLKPHVFSFLQKLKQNRVKMCIATATDRCLAEPALRRLNIADCFSFLLTCTETGFSKESGEIYEKALELLQTQKSETVVFEDALHAAQSAKNAGFPVIAVYDSSADNDAEKLKQTADHYIRSFEECEVEHLI